MTTHCFIFLYRAAWLSIYNDIKMMYLFLGLVTLKARRYGAAVVVDQQCDKPGCGHTGRWSNSEKSGYQYLINILISAAILFGGGLPTKVVR